MAPFFFLLWGVATQPAMTDELWSLRAHIAANLLNYQALTHRDKLCPLQVDPTYRLECHGEFTRFMDATQKVADVSERVAAAHEIEVLEYELDLLITKYAIQDL